MASLSLQLNSYWHSLAYLSSYDQMQIASYLATLPNSTVVYLPSNFSNIYSYMRFDNLSRFRLLMFVKNCSDLAPNSYVISGNPSQVVNSSFYHYISTCPNLSQIVLPYPSNSTPYYNQIHPDLVDLNLYHVQGNTP